MFPWGFFTVQLPSCFHPSLATSLERFNNAQQDLNKTLDKAIAELKAYNKIALEQRSKWQPR